MKPVFLYLATLSRYSTDYQVQANIELATVGYPIRCQRASHLGTPAELNQVNTGIATIFVVGMVPILRLSLLMLRLSPMTKTLYCRYQRFTVRTKQLIMNENGVAVIR